MKCINCEEELKIAYFECHNPKMVAIFFDNPEDNVFCSRECFAEVFELDEIDIGD